MNGETVLVAAIVGAAALYVARTIRRAIRGRSKCGCGSSGCPASREASERIFREAAPRRKTS